MNVVGNVVWSANDDYIFYTPTDESWIHYKVYRHALMDEPKNDLLVYHEKNRQSKLSLSQSQDRQYILIISQGHEKNEVQVIKADTPTAQLFCFRPRQPNVEYTFDCWQDQWVVSINDITHPNGRIFLVPKAQ